MLFMTYVIRDVNVINIITYIHSLYTRQMAIKVLLMTVGWYIEWQMTLTL